MHLQNYQTRNKIPQNQSQLSGSGRCPTGTTKRSRSKRTRGRTGWPETVWVEALASGSKANENPADIVDEEKLEPLAPHAVSPQFPPETTLFSHSLNGETEIFLDLPHHNQQYFESKESFPVFMVGSDADYGTLKNCIPCVEQILPVSNNHCAVSIANQDFQLHNSGSEGACSTPPDLIHASATSLPIVTQAVEPLPSITTLRSTHKDRCQNDVYPEFSSPEYGIINSDLLDYDFQNGHLEEPSFAELQPVARFTRKCAEMA